MEHGFYHPDRGYWQTSDTPSEAVLASYPEGTVEVTKKPGTDYTYNTETSSWDYTPPDELTNEEKRAEMLPLTARQFKLGLVRNSISLATVAAQIAAITDDLERQEAEIEWQTAAQFERLNPLVVSIATAIGLTDEQVDTMWLTALEY